MPDLKGRKFFQIRKNLLLDRLKKTRVSKQVRDSDREFTQDLIETFLVFAEFFCELFESFTFGFGQTDLDPVSFIVRRVIAKVVTILLKDGCEKIIDARQLAFLG